MAEEVVLMKGNEAIAHAAIRCGADGYFGYPITPQSEVLETLAELKPWETTGMVVLQAESEVAAINMVYGGAGSGKMVMTSSSSPGVSLKQEGISYLAGAELPCLIVNVMRGGPGLGTIQPSQADYFQTVKGGGHGDYRLIALAPASVQEMADFVGLAFELAFKYRNPAIILADGVIGQMMEKVVLPAQKPRRTDAEVIEQCPWATTGRTNGRKPNIITSLELKPEESKNFSLNLEYTHSRFSVSATAFVNNVTDMINYRTLSDEEAAQYGDYDEVRQRDNIDKVRIKGVNVNANAYLGLGFNLGAGYTLLDARNLITDKPIDKSVKYAGNVNAQWSKNWGLYGLNINMVGRGQGKRYSETYDYDSSGFMLWDLNTGHTFNLKYFILNAGLGVENLFDWVDDRPWNTKKPYSTITPGRAFYASLTIRFRK